MRLKFDQDYERELRLVKDKTIARGKSATFFHSVVGAVIVGLIIKGLQSSDASTGLMISVTIAVCTVWLAFVINRSTTVLHASLVLVVAAIEWFEKKKAGEVEE